MTTAFVLSGGASLGAIQVGMADALYERGIVPEMIIGTSVGAINGAWLAGGQPIGGLVDLWNGLGSRQIFPLHALVGLRGFAGRANHLIPDTGVRQLLEQNVTFIRLEDAPIPFSVMVSDVSTGEEVRLDRGRTIDAILASSALPGLFPPVTISGRTFVDGGVMNNTPISQAIEAGATDVWVLSTGYSCALPAPPKGAIAMAMHGLAMLVQQRFVIETAQRIYPVPVHLIPPPCPIAVTPTDFSRTADLIDRARQGTAQWIDNGEPFALPLLGHRHVV